MRIKILSVICVLLIFSALGAEFVSIQSEEVKKEIPKEIEVKKETLAEKQKRLDIVCEEMLEYGPVYPVSGPHIWAGKKFAWCVNNFVRADGWQLSGWSKVTLDKNFNTRRIKIGFISPELYTDEAVRMHNDRAKWAEFSRWNENVEYIAGISITWEF